MYENRRSGYHLLNCLLYTSVSTNSITQGEQVAGVWKPLYDRFGIHIDFAYRTFRWDSEANLKAHVHCVLVGFSVEMCIRDRAWIEVFYNLFPAAWQNGKGEESLHLRHPLPAYP